MLLVMNCGNDPFCMMAKSPQHTATRKKHTSKKTKHNKIHKTSK